MREFTANANLCPTMYLFILLLCIVYVESAVDTFPKLHGGGTKPASGLPGYSSPIDRYSFCEFSVLGLALSIAEFRNRERARAYETSRSVSSMPHEGNYQAMVMIPQQGYLNGLSNEVSQVLRENIRRDYKCLTTPRLSFTDFTQLYLSNVTYARYYESPLYLSDLLKGSSSSSRKKRRALLKRVLPRTLQPSHSGVVVTTDFNGESNWLIHRTDDVTCPTSIKDARTMKLEEKWEKKRCGYVQSGRYKLMDFYLAAIPDKPYDWKNANCHHAAIEMWDLISSIASCKSWKTLPF